MITFVVDGPAVPKQRPRLSGRTAYTPKKTRDYEERVRESFRSSYQGAEPMHEKGVPLRVMIWVAQAIPKSFSKKNRAKAILGEIVPTSRNGDIDNIAKSILDALNGVAYEDDSQVAHLIIMKRYGTEPKAVIKIERDCVNL